MELGLKIIIGCDFAGYDFKMEILEILRKKGYDVTDAGTNSSTEGDYPIYAKIVGERVVSGEFDRGIIVCGTGQGICMAANKVKGVRAALCFDVLPAVLSREHNNSNILSMGAWLMDVKNAERVIEAWLFARYQGGKHQARIDAMTLMEKS